jgi:flagellar protein FliO/FliZ
MEFFNDLSVLMKFLVAFVVVFAVLGAAGYLWRRLNGGNLVALGPRGRQPRLAVIDAASVDGRRRLVLVRRDNVEHLLLIGGPTDVVVEPNIDRTAAVATAPAPVRDTKASATLEPLPRQTMSLEGSGWPPSEPVHAEPPRPVREATAREQLTREPMPREAIAREAMTREPITREAMAWEPMPREAMTRDAMTRDAMAREPMPREAMTREAMVRPPPMPIERQRLESLIEDAGAPPLLPTPPEPGPAFYPPPVPPSFEPAAHPAAHAAPPFEPVFQIPPAPEPKRMPAAPPLPPRPAQSEESNLAEMAQRLEAALRRPIKPVEPVLAPPPPGPRFTSAPAPLPTPPARPAPLREVAPPPGPPATAREPAAPAFSRESVPDLKVVPADMRPTPAFTSIEEEMASLLGRSTGKP